MSHTLFQNVEYKYLINLDYPDVEFGSKGTWTFGDFGPAREEISEASGGGLKNYNVEMTSFEGLSRSLGLLSEGNGPYPPTFLENNPKFLETNPHFRK